VAEEDCVVYADHHSGKLFLEQIDFPCKGSEFSRDTKEVQPTSYFYFRAWNIQKKALTFATTYAGRQSISFDDLPAVTYVIDSGDRIYNNGGAQVLALSEAPP
jgi:uncharacterized membrane protein